MAKNHSICNQLQHALCETAAFGESKYAYKKAHKGKTGPKTYSIERMDNLRYTADSFGKFMKVQFPNTKRVDDILPYMVQMWINANTLIGRPNWTKATARTMRSNIIQVFERARKVWPSIAINLSGLEVPMDDLPGKIRKIAMTREDLELILDSYYQRGSKASGATALEITSRTGLRVKEVAFLKTECINLEKRVIEVREGAKNGRYRDVPIREKDISFFTQLKEHSKPGDFVIGVKTNSINRSIRKEMEEVGLSEVYPYTSEHSVRKMYAIERFECEFDKLKKEHPEYSSEKKRDVAWEKVQVELGHGDQARKSLYRTYVAEPLEQQGRNIYPC